MTNPLRFKHFRIKAFDAEAGTLEGYGSKFNVVDQVGDVVVPGAFKNSLMGGAQNIKFLWQHNPAEPIGIFTEMKEDERGLFFKAQLANTQRGQEARELMKMGAIDGFSIGYIPLIEERSEQKGRSVNLIKEVKLLEVSVVTFPCNTQARLESIKSQFDERFANLSLDEQELVRGFIDSILETKHIIFRNPEEEKPVTTSDEEESDAEQAEEAVEETTEEAPAETSEEVVEEEPEADKDDSLEALKSLRNELALKQLRDALKGK